MDGIGAEGVRANGQDVGLISVEVVDDQGAVVPTSSEMIHVSATSGIVLGTANGDPSSLEPNFSPRRSAFGGRLLAVVRPEPRGLGRTMTEGEQLTIQTPDPEFEEILLASAAMLGKTLIGDDDEGTTYALDTVWTVHQMEGDYNPVHFHNNARSMFGFSSFLHLQLPPQVGQRESPGEGGSEDGGTSFIWKTDSTATQGQLECPGVLSVEMQEGYLHVFPQWVQHFVWPFRGVGERRTIAANIARLPSGMAR
eukprot:g16819.t1